MKKLIYAGIGPQSTPTDALNGMIEIAKQLSRSGWILRSGHADGADTAFEIGAGDRKQIFLPWEGFKGTYSFVDQTGLGFYGRAHTLAHYDTMEQIARSHHPAWHRCSRGARALLTRNVPIILGNDLEQHVDCVITWLPQPNYQGGTRHALKIASTYGIPVFDMNIDEDFQALRRFVDEKEKEKEAA